MNKETIETVEGFNAYCMAVWPCLQRAVEKELSLISGGYEVAADAEDIRDMRAAGAALAALTGLYIELETEKLCEFAAKTSSDESAKGEFYSKRSGGGAA